MDLNNQYFECVYLIFDPFYLTLFLDYKIKKKEDL